MSIRQTLTKVNYNLIMYGGNVTLPGGHTHAQPLSAVNDAGCFSATSTLKTRYENITSVSSGNSKTYKLVEWRPKAPAKPIWSPRMPVFNPPKLPKRHQAKLLDIKGLSGKALQKVRRVNERRITRSEASYLRLLVVQEAKRKAYITKYAQRLKAYHEKMAKYNRLLSFRSKPYKKRVVTASERAWNPYSRTRISNSGTTYNVDTEYRARVIAQCAHGLPYLYSSTNPDRVMWRSTERGTRDFVPSAAHSQQVTLLKASVEAQAAAKLHGRLKDAQTHIGNLLAERQQTIGMLGSAVKGLAAAVSAKRGFFNSLLSNFKNPKEIADATLAFQFGIRPLVNDIYTSAEGLAKMLHGNARTKVHVISEQGDTVTKVTKNPGSVTTEVCKIKVKVSYTFELKVSNSLLNSLSQWGLVNPLEIGWETLPWSFAIDWVLPIGSWLNSLTSDAGLEYSRGCKVTTVTKQYSTYTAYDGSWQGQYRLSGQTVGAYVEETKTRELIISPPAYVLRFKNPFSTDHLIDAAALAVQRR